MHRIGRTERRGIWVAALLLLAGCASRTPAPTPSPTPLSPTPTAAHTPIPQPEPSPLAPTATTAPELPAGCADPASLPFGFDEFWEQAIPAYFDEGGTPEQLETVLNSLCGTLFGDRPEPVRAQVLTGDLDLNGSEDVLVGLTLPAGDGYGEAHLIAFLTNQGDYEPVILFRRAGAGVRAEGLYAGGGVHVAGIRDLNRDGSLEIVFGVNWDIYAEFYIVSMRGSDFVSLIERYDEILMQTIYRAEARGGRAEIEDTDADGIYEVVLIEDSPARLPSGATEISRRETWGWDGSLYSPSSVRYLPEPVYRIGAVRAADLAAQNRDFDAALALYQQVVFDEALLGWSTGYDPAGTDPLAADPDYRLTLAAYGRYRIMILHAEQGNRTEAETVFASLQDRLPPDSPYAVLAAEYIRQYRISYAPYRACGAAVEYVQSHQSEILGPLGFEYYGQYGLDYEPRDICP